MYISEAITWEVRGIPSPGAYVCSISLEAACFLCPLIWARPASVSIARDKSPSFGPSSSTPYTKCTCKHHLPICIHFFETFYRHFLGLQGWLSVIHQLRLDRRCLDPTFEVWNVSTGGWLKRPFWYGSSLEPLSYTELGRKELTSGRK